MRKLLAGSLALTLALAARPAFAQGPSAPHSFVGDNLQAQSSAAVAPTTSGHDWQQSAESKAQNKWKRGHFGKKKPGTKKGGNAKSHHPPVKKPAKKP